MKSLFIFFLTLGTTPLMAQKKCLEIALNKGQTAYDNGNYPKARQYWEAGKNCEPTNKKTLTSLIWKTKDDDNDGIVNGRDDCPTEAGIAARNGCTEPRDTNSKVSEILMVFVRGGTFQMGCTEEQQDCGEHEKPVREVTVSDFYIGQYEVTQKQWRDIKGSNPSRFSDCDDCPVEKVSWQDVQDFLQQLNAKYPGKDYRLPTEAEWEYAARGGKSNGFEFSGSDDLELVAWHDGNSMGKTHPVGLKKSNSLKIFDMSGNVCEWCQDYWHLNYEKAPIDGSAWIKGRANDGRVFRGGF